MKTSLSFRGAALFLGCLLFFALGTAFAYITTLSAPVVSSDTTDQHIYFQGPNNCFYKVASDNPEIEIASDDSPTWVDYDVTSDVCTRLGSSSTIISPASVPGDGRCYFQDSYNRLAKVQTNGSGFVDFGVSTLYAPAAPGDGYVYYFTDIDKVTGRTISRPYGQTHGKLYKIGVDSQGLAASTDLGQWGLSAPCVKNGKIYFQGADSRLLMISTTPQSYEKAKSFVSEYGVTYITTSSTPDVSSQGRIFFPRGENTYGGRFPSTISPFLSYIDSDGTNLYSTTYNTTITPYYAPDGYIYFVDLMNEVFQYNTTTQTATDLYIQAISKLTGHYYKESNSLTLIYQAPGNILTTYVVPH